MSDTDNQNNPPQPPTPNQDLSKPTDSSELKKDPLPTPPSPALTPPPITPLQPATPPSAIPDQAPQNTPESTTPQPLPTQSSSITPPQPKNPQTITPSQVATPQPLPPQEAPTPTLQPEDTSAESNSPINPVVDQEPAGTLQKKSHKNIKYLFITLFLLMIVSVVFYVLMKKDDTDTQPPPVQEATEIPTPSPIASDSAKRVDPDYTYESEGTLPFSKSFMASVIGGVNSGRLDVDDGFGAEIIAIGGDPSIYNFSIGMPLDWTRDIMTTTFYESVSPDELSTIGVRYFTKGSDNYNEFVDCSTRILNTVKGFEDKVSIEIDTESQVTLEGRLWDRNTYTMFSQNPTKRIGLGVSQCYKNADEIIVVYVELATESVAKYRSSQIKILDDFLLKKLN